MKMSRAALVPAAALLAALASGLGGCGSSTAGGGGGGGGATGTTTKTMATVPFTCAAGSAEIVEGLNAAWNVGTTPRDFYAALPTVTPDTPVSVIFQFHGLGDSASNFKSFMLRGGVGPNTDADFPFIMITPQSLQLYPVGSVKAGMEWDLFDGSVGAQNYEAELFEGVLGCLATKYKIDASRIYTVGFSAGAILSNLLHSRYPDMIGAVYAASGAWFNDPAQSANVQTSPLPKPTLKWAPLSPEGNGTIIVSHGGPNDKYVLLSTQVISFEACAGMAMPFLATNHRTALDCPHKAGHQPNAALSPRTIIDFLKAHKAGEPSPYKVATDLPAAMQTACTLQAL